MKRAEFTASALQAVRERGVQVAVDDFGTGYSSLSYLRKFPVDALKIDQSFVRQISSGDDTTIVTAVIGMARSLKLRVVAEGVETLEEAGIFFALTNATRRKGTISASRCLHSGSPNCSKPESRNRWCPPLWRKALRELMCAGHPRNADAEWQRLAQHPETFSGAGRECPQV